MKLGSKKLKRLKMNSNVLIAPSILSADFGKLNEEVADVENFADVLHFDVMDGHFVPNLSFGAPVLKWIKTSLPKHCHLMVTNPGARLKEFKEAGADMIIFHQEVVEDLAGMIGAIKALGMKAGISIKPATPADTLSEVIDELDQVLVMSVEPGFGGQSFIPESLDKIRALRAMREDLVIAVDGGINAETAPAVIEAGANELISGSYLFKAPDRKAAADALRV